MVKSSAKTLPWAYQPCTYTVTVPDAPVVNGTDSCVYVGLDVQVLDDAPPLTPTNE